MAGLEGVSGSIGFFNFSLARYRAGNELAPTASSGPDAQIGTPPGAAPSTKAPGPVLPLIALAVITGGCLALRRR